MFPVLLIALVGAGVWGYREHQEKNAILIKAENQYQRAFNNLAFHMNELNEQLGNALAVGANSSVFHRKCLVNVWRISSEAQNEINQLPLTLLPFSKTEDFLSSISKFSYHTAVRDLTKEPLSDQEVSLLEKLYERSKELSSELRKIQSQVLDQNIRWMDVEMAIATQDMQSDNTIIDGFKTVDNKVMEFTDVDFGPSNLNLFNTGKVRKLEGKDISKDEAKKIAFEFLQLPEDLEVTIAENGKGTEYESYSVTLVDEQDDGSRLNVDVAKRGGKVLYFMNHRDVDSSQLSVEEATQRAQRFLDDHDYGELTPVSYDTYQNTASITFATVQDDVIIYPQKLVVQVALDNGEITGLHATDFVYESHTRQLEQPTLTLEEARSVLNTNFQVDSTNLALIENDLNEEVVCYEFTGRINGGIYRIYINGNTGMEEKIEHIKASDQAAQQA
jgi:spore germination protein